MKFNENRAKEAGIDTVAAVAGAVGGLALSNKATSLAADKAPSFARHAPALMLGALVALQAFDVVPDNPLVDSAIQGASVVCGMQVVREYTGANTAAGRTATTGMAALINKYVPDTTDTAGTTTAAVAAAAVTPALASGTNGIGRLGNPLSPYRDPAQAFLLAGRENGSLQTLGEAPTSAGLKDLG